MRFLCSVALLQLSFAESSAFNGCGVPVEQVRLAWPAGDVLKAQSMSVAFIGGSDAVQVQYQRSDSIELSMAPVARLTPYQGFDDQDGQRLLNVAKMTRLEPGLYTYRIVDEPGTNCTDPRSVFEGEFTFGPKTTGAVRLAVLGDMGVNHGSEHGGCFSSDACSGAGRVKELILGSAASLDAVFNIGDIAYAAGNDPIWDDYGLEIANITDRLPWMTAVGNHEWATDAECECGTPYNFRFPMPTGEDGTGIDFDSHRERICYTTAHQEGSAACPGADDDKAFNWREMAYSIDIGDVRVVVVSTAHGCSPGMPQFEWLRQTLSTRPKKWQVVMGHIDACYPCDSYYNTTQPCYCWPYGGPSGLHGATSMGTVQRHIFDHKLPVDLVLAGHTHEFFMRNCTGMPVCTSDSEEGPPLAIVGGSGYGSDATQPGDAAAERAKQCSYAPYGYVELQFGSDAIDVTYRAVENTGRSDFDQVDCTPEVEGKCAAIENAKLFDGTGLERCTPASFKIVKSATPTSECTSAGQDPWVAGQHTPCCVGLVEELHDWESNGQWFYRCSPVVAV